MLGKILFLGVFALLLHGGEIGHPAFAGDASSRCDQLAADPADPDRPGRTPGVLFIAPGEAETAVSVCEAAAADPNAHRRFAYQLGRAYEARDFELLGNTIPAYTRAANRGSSAAMAALGQDLMSQDFQAAKAWLEKAADRGNASAMRNLGDMFLYGLGINADRERALDWYGKAAELGDAPSNEILNSARAGR